MRIRTRLRSRQFAEGFLQRRGKALRAVECSAILMANGVRVLFLMLQAYMGWKRIADWLELCGCCGHDAGVEDQAAD